MDIIDKDGNLMHLLFAALTKAQAMFLVPKKSKTNPHFKAKYADLNDVIDATKEGLAKNDLAISQGIKNMVLITTMTHKSGEYIETECPLLLDKQTMQGLGSAMAYARRYAWSAICGIASEDDDGNEASKEEPKAPEKKDSQNPTAIITDAQRNRLFAIMKTQNWTQEQVKLYMDDKFGFTSTKELNREKYDLLIDAIQKGSYVSAMKGEMTNE